VAIAALAIVLGVAALVSPVVALALPVVYLAMMSRAFARSTPAPQSDRTNDADGVLS
jgi:hypothetical protein